MNFNLVSPYDSAHNFTARFKEEIQIPKNSSIYLNYVKIERDRRIVLQNTNTIELIYDYPLPKFIPSTGGVNGPTGDAVNTPTLFSSAADAFHTITIEKGTYSATSLAELVNKKIQTLYNRTNEIQNTAGLYNCGPLNVLNFREANGDVSELVNNRGESGILLSIIQNQLDAVYANAPKDDGGVQPLNSYLNAEFIADPDHHTNDTGNGGNENLAPAYSKSAEITANAYDNYAISQSPLQHYGLKTFGTGLMQDSTANQSMFVNNGGDIETHLETSPRLWATTRRILDDINTAQAGGREFCGLYSAPYAEGNPQIAPANMNTMGFSTNAERTRGTGANNGGNLNPEVKDGVPQCYFGVEVGGRNGAAGNYKTLKVYGGAQDTGGTAFPPTRPNQAKFIHGGAKFDRMILLKTIALDDILNGNAIISDDDVVSFAIVPYYKSQYLSGRNDSPTESVYQGFVNRTKLFFAVCLKTTSSGWIEVYDSGEQRDNEWYIMGDLIEGANNRFTNKQSKDMINMNIPFHPLLSSVSINGGFQRVSYTAFERGPDASPRTLIDRVRFKFSRELSSYIDSSKTEVALDGQSIVPVYTSHPIYPTLPHYIKDFFPILPFFQNTGGIGGASEQAYAGLVALTNLYADTSDDAYVVYINNLPLKNYKNTRNSRLVNETHGGYNKNILANVPLPYQTQYVVDNRLIGYYEPFLKAISDMKNQNTKINYFDIEIRNALDDSPADYLRSAVINFTIVDKKSKLIN